MLVGGFLGPASPQFSLYLDWFLPGGLDLFERGSIGLTYVQAPHLLVYTNFLIRDRVGGQGITTGFEYVISSRRRWRPELAGDVSHYWPSGSTVESISMGIRF